MWGGIGKFHENKKLLTSCDPEYINAHTCTSVIISRFWKRARAHMPPAERSSLEALETKLERVRVKPAKVKELPLKVVVASFNEAIHAQLPEDARFVIRYDPVHADRSVPVAWNDWERIPLREAVRRVAVDTHLNVKKTPPDLVLEPS